MKTLIPALLSAAALLAGVSAASAQAKPEKTDIHIGAASTGITYLPMIIATAKGYFKDEGLNVTIAAFSGGSKALEALLGGSVDTVAGAYSNTLTMAAKGQKLVVFAAQVSCPGWIFGVAKKDADKVQSVKDLKGMRVGVSAPGSSTHMAVNYMLHKAGLEPSDVSIIGVGQAAGAVAAIKAGQINALIVNDPVASLLTDSGDLKVLAEMRTEEGNKKVFGADYPESSLYSTKAFVDKNPNTVQALANGIVRAERWMTQASPDEIAKSVPAEYRVDDPKLYAKAVESSRRCISKTGMITPEGAQTVKDVLAAFLPAVANVDTKPTYDNSFVEKAAQKFK